MSRERAETGEYVETVTTDRVLGVFSAVEGPIVTTADVADRLECTTEAARRKLNDLHTAGTVGRRKTAGRVVYWLREASAPNDVDPDDDFWNADPIAGDDELSVTDLDDVLYDPATDE